MRRCWGRTLTLHRCGRVGNWYFFCRDHVYQPILLLSFLIFTVGGWFIDVYSILRTENLPDIIRNFEAQVRVVFSGDWSGGTVPTSQGLLIPNEITPALTINVNMKSGEMKELELYTIGTAQITEAPSKRAVLEYSCKVRPGAWIFGRDVSKIKNFSMVSLKLHGVNSTVTSNSLILLETITIKFFSNGEEKSTYMVSPYKEIQALQYGTLIRWP